MASIGKDKGGRKRVLFVAPDGSRKTIRLGKCSLRQAETFKVRLETLVAAQFGGLDADTAKWVANLPDDIHAKLTAVGLVEPRAGGQDHLGDGATLAAFLDGYLKDRDDLKPNSLLVYGHTRRTLVEFFGPDKPLIDITEYDAEQWQRYLGREGLSKATVRKRTANAKVFLRVGVKQKIIASNPFQELQSASVSNDERQFFIDPTTALKVLDACPDAQWRLIFALSRYGGLRCPSEHLALTWGDVDWEVGRMTVHSPKTAHHEGKESRVIPLFPEIVPHLRETFEQAEPGSRHVITRYRQKNCNLRTQLHRILKRAGVKPWPRLFQNLRSSRETELAETYPLHVVTEWIGNSKAIAAKHYLQLRDSDFERAIQAPTSAAQNPAQSAHAKGGNGSQSTTKENGAIGAFQGVTKGCELAQVLTGQDNGDGGNRTLISAMRPRCAPVTPHPQTRYSLFYLESAKCQPFL